jgi:hypothetical protein
MPNCLLRSAAASMPRLALMFFVDENDAHPLGLGSGTVKVLVRR